MKTLATEEIILSHAVTELIKDQAGFVWALNNII